MDGIIARTAEQTGTYSESAAFVLSEEILVPAEVDLSHNFPHCCLAFRIEGLVAEEELMEAGFPVEIFQKSEELLFIPPGDPVVIAVETFFQ